MKDDRRSWARAKCEEVVHTCRLTALLKGPGAETIAVDVFRVRGGAKQAFRVFSDLAASDTPEGAREKRITEDAA